MTDDPEEQFVRAALGTWLLRLSVVGRLVAIPMLVDELPQGDVADSHHHPGCP